MACDGKTYVPNPPRLWSRVQLPCSQIDMTSENYYKYLMLKKGNILQYKKNSSCFTNKQIYSLISQKKWTNRNTTWGTQNDRGYTNPNTKMLKRNNAINITIDGTETFLPTTCPSIPSSNNNTLPMNQPSQDGNAGKNPELPPIMPETSNNGSVLPPSNETIPNNPIVIQDLGTLTCNVIENPCTSYTKVTQSNNFYHPTSDSDVPGKIEFLYWNESMQSWFPKEQRKMTNGNVKLTDASIPATAYDK